MLVNNNGTPNDPTDDTLIYTPSGGFLGNDSFLYSISDANLDSSTATVYINVGGGNPQPVYFEKTAVVQGNGNVGDTVLYTFKVTNNTSGTISNISVFDSMLSNNTIGEFGGCS